MLYRLKINRFNWYRINGELIRRITREDVLTIIDNLDLKSIRSVKQNKKPYIMVKLTSEDEYNKLKRRLRRV